jgi:hypothetical protein
MRGAQIGSIAAHAALQKVANALQFPGLIAPHNAAPQKPHFAVFDDREARRQIVKISHFETASNVEFFNICDRATAGKSEIISDLKYLLQTAKSPRALSERRAFCRSRGKYLRLRRGS